MYTKQRSLAAVLAAMALVALSGSAMAAITPHYALATSSSQVYMLGTDAGWAQSAFSKQVTYEGLTATGLTGIAVKDNYAYVADSATDSLYVLKMRDFETSPTFDVVNAISLNNGTDYLVSPSSVQVDASGNVYVIDSAPQVLNNQRYSTYAYIDKNVIDPSAGVTAKVTKVNGAVFTDIAITSNGGIIAHKNNITGTIPGATWVSGVSGESVNNQTALNDGNDVENYYPIGIAVNSDVAYIANALGSSALGEEFGSLTLFNTSTWDKMGSTLQLPGDLIPSAIATFTRDSNKYLAVMGTGSYGGVMTNVQQALLYSLDEDGNLGIAETAVLDAGDYSQHHKCAASEDGEVFWFTNQEAGTVGAWSATNWGNDVGSFEAVTDIFGNIVAYKYVAPVPEPSGLIALMSFTAGMIGLIKRRRLG